MRIIALGHTSQHDYNRGHHFGHYLNDIKENGELSESSVSDLKGWFKALPCNSANIYYNGTIGKFTVDVNADYMQTKDMTVHISTNKTSLPITER